MSTDPRSGPSPSDAQSIPAGAAPSPQQPMVTVLALAEIRRRKQLNQALLVRASWEQLELVFDLLVEMHVSLRPAGVSIWRTHCTMCGRGGYLDLHDRTRIAHGSNCLMGRLCAARRPVDRSLGWLLDALTHSPERRQPDTTPDATIGRAAVEQPSPAPDPLARIGGQLDAIAEAGKAARL